MGDNKVFVHVDAERTVGFSGLDAIYILHPNGSVTTTPHGSMVREISVQDAFGALRRSHESFLIDIDKQVRELLVVQAPFYGDEELDRKERVYNSLLNERAKYVFPKRIIELRASRDVQEGVLALTKELSIPDAKHYIVNRYGQERIVEQRSALVCHNPVCDISLLENLVKDSSSFPFKVGLLSLPNNEIVQKLFAVIPYQKVVSLGGEYSLSWKNEDFSEE